MQSHRNNLTDLAIAHGSIQVSPQQLAELNNRPRSSFGAISGNNSNTGYKLLLSGYAEYVLVKEAKTKNYDALTKLLEHLKSTPRPATAFALRGSVDTLSFSNSAYRVDYRVHSGEVTIFNIQLVDRIQLQRDKAEKSALYHIKKSANGHWQNTGKVASVNTPHAAVNGQSNNLVKATWLMGSHLEFGKGVAEYTLYHNPSVGGPGDTWESLQDKLGFTTEVTRKFSDVLQNSQKSMKETKWIAHSQGGGIFAESVRYLLNGKSSFALNKLRLNGINHPEKGKLLDKQAIAFHGNANNNWRSKPLLKRAGIKVIAVRNHDYDMVPNIIGMNTLNPRKLIGSLVYASHVFSGSVPQSPHSTVQSHESWEKSMENGPGKGRNTLQRVFHSTTETINNYLP